MSHIIGRPDDDVLEILLGHGTDPEQAFIGGSQRCEDERHRFEEPPHGDEPTVREP